MHQAFSFNNYTIKPQGLSIGGKYRALDPHNEPALHIEHKTRWSAPFNTYHVYADDKKKQEILLIEESEHGGFPDFYAVTDPAGNEKVGGIGVDWKNWFEDAWGITDAQGTIIGRVREKSAGRAILHQLTEGFVPQIVNIIMGDQVVAELRQKSVMIGHHLLVDFSGDAAGRLDRRLGLAIAIVVAARQGATDSV
ncbi:MAG: hypothetical protein FD146_1709 [Anaerolineaceae bacterium]|nr:MAG: hypothetical protein FD146_1709 [Anaerolineaceae bacterium]